MFYFASSLFCFSWTLWFFSNFFHTQASCFEVCIKFFVFCAPCQVLRNYNLCVMWRKVVSLSLVPSLCAKEALHMHATTSYNGILLSMDVASYCCVLLQPIVVCCYELLQLPTTNLNHRIDCCFIVCHNLSIGLATKASVYKGVGRKKSSKVKSHALRSVGECEGMNPHTPKWAFTLGVGILMDFQTFRDQLQGSKPIGLRSSLYHWKALETLSKMNSHDPFGHFNHKYSQKKGVGVKLAIWFQTIKN